MKIYAFGKEDAPVILLLPGTCCHWKGNFLHVIPLLEADFRVLCVSYDGFDETERTEFPTMIDETEKIENYIQKHCGGHIRAAYGCSLGGSFVGLLAARKRIRMDYGILGSSDLDQASKFAAKLQTNLLLPMIYPLIHNGQFKSRFLQKQMEKRTAQMGDYVKAFIVGYNDDKEEFDIVDPWNPNWGGQHGGVGKLPYESLHVACVNCTAEKGTRLSLISHKIRPVLIEENASLAVDLGFYEPLGYVIDRNNTKFETFKVTIHYLFNGNEKQQSQSLSGEWKIGEKAIFTFPLEKELSGDIDVRIEVLATLSSDRPYQYRDNICMDFTETVKINRSSGVSQKESVISSINASNY